MKIKAFRMEPETVDYESYFDFDGWEDFIITGNDHLASFHTEYDLYDRIQNYCVEYNELQEAIEEAGTDYSNYKNATEAIEDFLGFAPTTKQVHDIKEALEEADAAYPYTNFTKLTVKLLSICEKRQWTTSTIIGSCQGDYQTVLYPADSYDNDFINYIESIYFGTGDEYAICECNDDDDIDNPYDCDNTYYNYYQSDVAWNDNLLRDRIAKDTGVSPEDVILYDFTNVMHTVWAAA